MIHSFLMVLSWLFASWSDKFSSLKDNAIKAQMEPRCN